MEWISIDRSLGICQIAPSIFIFIDRTATKYNVYAKAQTGEEEFTTLTGIYTYKFNQLVRAYSNNSSFYRDFKSAVDGVIPIDLNETRENIKQAVLDVQNGTVVLDIPKVPDGEKNADNFELDMEADVYGILRPTDSLFHAPDNFVIFEPCWLPYTNVETSTSLLFPTVLMKTADSFEILRYFDNMRVGRYFISGAFPSFDLDTLISMNGVRKLIEAESGNINIAELLLEVDKDIDTALVKHIDLDKIKRIITKRWIEGTYFYTIMDSFPIFNIMGPSESGKTRLGLCLTSMSYHGDASLDLTEAGIFRTKEEIKPTIVVDEAEYLADPESHKRVKLLINASYSKGLGVVHRYDDYGGARVRVKFDLYSPMAIIAINPLTGITASRSIAINMVRTEKDMPKALPHRYIDLRDKLYTLKFQLSPLVWKIFRELNISDIVTARFDELFRPLFVLTKIFGTDEEYDLLGEWAKQYQYNFRISAINIIRERNLLMVLSEMLSTPEKYILINGMEYIYLRSLAEAMMTAYGEKFTSNKVSNILRSLGFTERERSIQSGSKGLTLARVLREDVQRVMIIYGIETRDKDE